MKRDEPKDVKWVAIWKRSRHAVGGGEKREIRMNISTIDTHTHSAFNINCDEQFSIEWTSSLAPHNSESGGKCVCAPCHRDNVNISNLLSHSASFNFGFRSFSFRLGYRFKQFKDIHSDADSLLLWFWLFFGSQDWWWGKKTGINRHHPKTAIFRMKQKKARAALLSLTLQTASNEFIYSNIAIFWPFFVSTKNRLKPQPTPNTKKFFFAAHTKSRDYIYFLKRSMVHLFLKSFLFSQHRHRKMWSCQKLKGKKWGNLMCTAITFY